MTDRRTRLSDLEGELYFLQPQSSPDTGGSQYSMSSLIMHAGLAAYGDWVKEDVNYPSCLASGKYLAIRPSTGEEFTVDKTFSRTNRVTRRSVGEVPSPKQFPTERYSITLAGAWPSSHHLFPIANAIYGLPRGSRRTRLAGRLLPWLALSVRIAQDCREKRIPVLLPRHAIPKRIEACPGATCVLAPAVTALYLLVRRALEELDSPQRIL